MSMTHSETPFNGYSVLMWCTSHLCHLNTRVQLEVGQMAISFKILLDSIPTRMTYGQCTVPPIHCRTHALAHGRNVFCVMQVMQAWAATFQDCPRVLTYFHHTPRWCLLSTKRPENPSVPFPVAASTTIGPERRIENSRYIILSRRPYSHPLFNDHHRPLAFHLHSTAAIPPAPPIN